MDTIIRSRLSTAVLTVAAILLPVGGAIAQGGMMDGGSMGTGHWYGSGGVWLPALAIVVVGAVLFAVLRRQAVRLATSSRRYQNTLINSTLKEKNPMKTPIFFATVITCALVVPVASAQDAAAPAKPAMSMPMDAHMSQMHTNMTLMQSQMDTIRATTNPLARQKLMQAHMQTMQDSTAMMRSMDKPMSMDGGQGGGMAMGGDKGKPGDKGMMGGDMMKHHQMMEERMGMMQTMMDRCCSTSR